jgi:hypothetical protein
MKQMDSQIRGNCQCCARQQAVVNGRMSKHGYTVTNGWFQGVCGGDRHEPMQVSRTTTDGIVFSVRADVVALLAQADQVLAGNLKPTKITRGNFMKQVEIDFANATKYEQDQAAKMMEWKIRSRAKAGEDFAKYLAEVADQKHGTALVEVERKEALVPVSVGDQKTKDGKTYICRYVQGARVHYRMTRGEQTFKGWIGVTAWRKMALN